MRSGILFCTSHFLFTSKVENSRIFLNFYNKEKVQDTKAAETNRELGKIQVVKPEEFEILHRATNS